VSPDLVFAIANACILPAWAVLIFAPRALWPLLDAIPRLVVPVVLSLFYAAFILAHFSESGGGYGSIAEVRQLFASDAVLVAGWMHYLVFDLLVACGMATGMDRAGVGRIVQGAVLPAIFLFGPLGWLLAFALTRGIRLSRPALV
jgi:hypothetical protein